MSDEVLLSDLSHCEKVMIYVVGMLDDLVEKDVLCGGAYKTSAAGEAIYASLKASGFRPTEEEIQEMVAFLQSGEAHAA